MRAGAGDVLAGRYCLIEHLGSGGFGETWRAADELLGMDVALKVFWEGDSSNRERYLREARALARYAGDPGVVAIRDLVETDDCVMLVMEHLAGQDLQSHLQERGSLSLAETVQLLTPIADVLGRMHADGFVHRDVSPDNIRVLGDGVAKLLDFGSVGGGNTATSTITVKPGYAPPEQYATADDQGPWTDVYALAATIYQCLTGRVPTDSLQRTFHDELPRPSQVGANVSAGADEAVMAALAPDYHKRTKDVATFMAALQTEAGRSQPSTAGGADAVTAAAAVPIDFATAAPATTGMAAVPAAPVPAAVPSAPAVAPGTPGVGITSVTGMGAAPAPADSAPGMGVAPAIAPADSAPGMGVAPAIAPAAPSAPVPAPAAPAAPAPSRKPAKPAKSGKIRLVIVGILVILLAAAGLFALRMCSVGGSGKATPYRTNNTTTSRVNDETVTESTLNTLANDVETDTLYLSRCVLDDEAINRIAGMDHIASLSLNKCTGFSTLRPLLESSHVHELELNGYEEFDCSAMLPGGSPDLTFLRLCNMKLKNADALLDHFPSLEQLALTQLEGIQDVSAIASMPNLEQVILTGIDLSGERADVLANHSKLWSLEAAGSAMETVEWASTCPELKMLRLDGNAITDISALSSCTHLDHVYLSGNAIEDISPLAASAESLFELEIAGNSIQSIEALANAERLYVLDARGNKIADISALAGCPALSSVNLSGNSIADASPLASCEKVKRLGISHNQLTNLNFCENMIKLTELDASFNQIEDMSKLSSCSLAERVMLQDNRISDISALSNGFASLELLNIANNQVKSLEPLESCALLCRVAIYNNQITSLNGLENKPNLWILLADSNAIEDISALSSSSQHLEYVDLGHNAVVDISALSGLFSTNKTPGVAGIHGGGVAVLLDYNKVERVDALPVRKDYRVIALHGNPVRDVAHLASDEMRWDCMYLPYVEGADYSNFSAYLNVDMNFVDVPPDKRAAVLRESLKAVDPDFLTGEQADAELNAYRAELYKNVSGEEEEAAAEGEGASADASADAEASAGADADVGADAAGSEGGASNGI